MINKKIKVLIHTDLQSHSAENSIFELAVKMQGHKSIDTVEIVSRTNNLSST